MADLDVTIRRKVGAGYDVLHPTTTWDQVNNKPTTFTPTSHTHGVISNTGSISASTVAVSSGDALLMTDVSNSNTIQKSAIVIGASTSTFLRNDGAWATPASGGWTSLYSGGPTIVTASTATWTAFALGYTPAAGDIFALKVSYGSTSSAIEKAICFVEYGTFSSTTGMSLVSFFGYGGVSGTNVVGWNIGAQWQISGSNLQLRYPTYSAWNSTTLAAATSFYVWEIWKVN